MFKWNKFCFFFQSIRIKYINKHIILFFFHLLMMLYTHTHTYRKPTKQFNFHNVRVIRYIFINRRFFTSFNISFTLFKWILLFALKLKWIQFLIFLFSFLHDCSLFCLLYSAIVHNISNIINFIHQFNIS